jgi:signal transduction histidine kinase
MDRRGLLVDGAVAVLALAVSATVVVDAGPDPALREPDAAAYLLLAVYSFSVVLRRPSPAVAVAVGLAAGLAYTAAGYPRALTPVALLSVYSAGVHMEQRSGRWLIIPAVGVAALGSSLGPGPTSLGVPLVVLGAWLMGRSGRDRRLYTAALEAKNRELEAAQHELARQAVTEERLRIARELHDVVAHSLSVVAVHAGTGRMVAAHDAAAAARALETIETTSRGALREMRQLLGVLRSGDGHVPGDVSPSGPVSGTLRPAPGLGDLPMLVAEVATSGPDVELRISGDRPAVPAGVDLSAYRVVQEALTNVLKHAGASHAVVDVGYTDREVTVEVVDDGRGSPSPPAAGHGLTGMRERVAVHGGTLEAGPRAGGGFRVAARFPLDSRR